MKPVQMVVLGLVGLGAAGVLLLRPAHEASEQADTVRSEGMPRLVELGSTSCKSCKAMHAELARLREECGTSIAVEEIDVWRDPAASERYAINVIPTQVFLDAQGRELDRHVGFLSRAEIRGRFARHGTECRQ